MADGGAAVLGADAAHRAPPPMKRHAVRYPVENPPIPSGWTRDHGFIFVASLALPLFLLVTALHRAELIGDAHDRAPCLVRDGDRACVDAAWRCAATRHGVALDAPPVRAGPLDFVHIPKTGGTGIVASLGAGARSAAKRKRGFFRDGRRCRCSAWHVPPRYAPRARHRPQTFCVVRDPLERLLSEFRFREFPDRNDRDAAEAWLRTVLPKLNSCDLDCHLLPQHEFVWDARGRRTCDHVLRHDRLRPGFDALTEAANATLAQAPTFRRRLGAPAAAQVTAAQIDPSLARSVRCAYETDLCLFGFDAAGARPPGANASLQACSGAPG